MKTIVIIIASCMLLNACNNKIIPSVTAVTNQLSTDSKGVPMLLGHCTPASMQQMPFSKWYDSAFNAYQPNAEQTAILKEKLTGTHIEIFLGTWCSDSKREVPRLLKTLVQSGMDTNSITLIMVDHEGAATKASPQHEEKGKYIFRVPTAIVYVGNKEAGRIIESPKESWEKDMVKIALSQPYTPNYNAVNSIIKRVKNKKVSDDQLAQMAAEFNTTIKNSASLNSLGYLLLNQQQTEKAFNIFKLNTILFPAESNVWDSLAEANATVGNSSTAIELYKKVLSIKPNDANATEQLKKLNAL